MFDADDDEMDFVPAAGSKLASVFGLEKSKENGNPSLVYTPQKKPKPVEPATESQPASASEKSQVPSPRFSVIIADIVHSFKLVAGVYSDQMKVGAAVLGNAQAHAYQVLLYRTTQTGKQDYIAVAKVTGDFRFLVQPKLYCSFYDEAKYYWSLVFNSETSCKQFAREVGAAQFRSLYGKSVITQLLYVGEEGKNVGDTMHLTISQQPFDINSISPYTPTEATVKVSIYPSQAKWSEGLVSASPGSQWAIFIPAKTPLPWAAEVSQAPLALEVIVEKMVQAAPSSLTGEPEKGVPSGEDSVQAKGASLTESLSSNVSSSKASLISRVARMGQPTLPLKGAVFSNPTDSEDTEEEASSTISSGTVKPPVKPKFSKARSGGRHSASDSDFAPKAVTTAAPAAPVTSAIWKPASLVGSENKLVQYVSGDGHMVALPSNSHTVQLVASTPVTSPSEPVAMFISEARMQNTEMRMNMTRIMDKIDTLATKVDGISSGGGSRAASAPMPPAAASAALDPGNLLSSIEKLVRDNQTLTAEVADKNEKLNELNERVYALVNANAKILEQNKSLLDEKQKSTESADVAVVQKQQIETLEKEKAALVEKASDLETRLVLLEEFNSQLKATKEFELSSKDSELSAKDCELGAKTSELSLKDSELCSKDAELMEVRASLAEKEAELKAALAELNTARTSSQLGDSKVEHAETKAQRFEADNLELKELVTILSTNITELESANAALQASQEEIKTALESAKKSYEETIAQLKSELENASKDGHDYNAIVMDIKLMMNKVYRKISQYFDGEGSVHSTLVRQTVAMVLKAEVTQYVEDLLSKKNRPSGSSDVGGPVRAAPPVANEVAKKEERTETKSQPAEHPAGVPSQPQPTAQQPTSPHPTSQHPTSQAAAVSAAAKADPKNVSARPQTEFWRSEPPPVPDFEEEENDDDWLKIRD